LCFVLRTRYVVAVVVVPLPLLGFAGPSAACASDVASAPDSASGLIDSRSDRAAVAGRVGLRTSRVTRFRSNISRAGSSSLGKRTCRVRRIDF